LNLVRVGWLKFVSSLLGNLTLFYPHVFLFYFIFFILVFINPEQWPNLSRRYTSL